MLDADMAVLEQITHPRSHGDGTNAAMIGQYQKRKDDEDELHVFTC